MRDQYMINGEGFLVVYSITSRISFSEVVSYQQHINRIKDGRHVPIVIVGNKCDLENARQVGTSEGRDLAMSYGVPFFETSALTKVNLEEAFFALVRCVRQHQPNRFAPASKPNTGKVGTSTSKRACELF